MSIPIGLPFHIGHDGMVDQRVVGTETNRLDFKCPIGLLRYEMPDPDHPNGKFVVKTGQADNSDGIDGWRTLQVVENLLTETKADSDYAKRQFSLRLHPPGPVTETDGISLELGSTDGGIYWSTTVEMTTSVQSDRLNIQFPVHQKPITIGIEPPEEDYPEGRLRWAEDVDTGGETLMIRFPAITQGDHGETPTLVIGTTGEGDAAASVEATGTPNEYKLNFTVPRGNPGVDGETPTLVIGTTGEGDAAASVEATGTPNEYKLNFTVPRGFPGVGEDGATPTLVTGTIGRGDAAASVVPTGNPNEYQINFTIPSHEAQKPITLGFLDSSAHDYPNGRLYWHEGGITNGETLVIQFPDHSAQFSEINGDITENNDRITYLESTIADLTARIATLEASAGAVTEAPADEPPTTTVDDGSVVSTGLTVTFMSDPNDTGTHTLIPKGYSNGVPYDPEGSSTLYTYYSWSYIGKMPTLDDDYQEYRALYWVQDANEPPDHTNINLTYFNYY